MQGWGWLQPERAHHIHLVDDGREGRSSARRGCFRQQERTTFIWLMMGVSAIRVQRCTAACTASQRLAPSASSSSMRSLPARNTRNHQLHSVGPKEASQASSRHPICVRLVKCW